MGKKIISLMMAFVLVFVSFSSTAYAEEKTCIKSFSYTEDSVTINGVKYTLVEFESLLEQAYEVKTNQSTVNEKQDSVESEISSKSVALVPAVYFIPGIGEVVITVGCTILIGGVVIKAGSVLYKTIVKWVKKYQFNKSAENAVGKCEPNKQNHIMKDKHKWNKLKKNPKWSNISPILIKTLKKGKEIHEKRNQYLRYRQYKNGTVYVRFIKDAKGMIERIGTAWCK